MKRLISVVLICCLFSSIGMAKDNKASAGKHYLLIGEPGSAALSALINKPSDLAINYGKELENIGGELISYYFAAGSARMYAIIVFPDSDTATSHLYQRMSSGIMNAVDIIELVPSDQMVEVLKQSKNFQQIFKSKGNSAK